ncbi:MAG: hypothetical protein Q8P03_01130 [bacterium]|nr:hypothetical protein [bacterium]
MNKNILIGIVIIAAVVLVGVWMFSQQGTETQQESEAPADTTGSIQADLDALDLGDLDAEFESIDQDLNDL